MRASLQLFGSWLLLIFVSEAELQKDIEAGIYDFVIVGAGSGGAVLANRLSEITDWKILLLEAGKEETFITDVPLLAPLMQITDYNWGYRTEPSNSSDPEHGYCLSMTEGKCNWPRGKALGGTSVINFMLYTRGTRSDYDAWEALGNPGWSYEDVLPYFLKSENSRLKHRKDEGYHASGGYLDVDEVPYASKLRDAFLRAGYELGYRADNDYNGRSAMGFSRVQANLRGGRRVSAAKAFLGRRLRWSRGNLRISLGSRVIKILIGRRSRRAVGVRYLGPDGRSRVARARREVLLCAGTLASPQLLMLSGVGARDELARHGVEPLVEDLPGVGRNLQDHVSMAALSFLVNDSLTLVESRLAANPLYALDYLLRGSGPFTVPGGAEALAFVDTKALLEGRADNSSYPDIELVLGIGALTGDLSGGMRSLLGLSEQFERRTFAEYKGRDAFSIVPILVRPKSRGRVSLRSADPLEPPRLVANYYERQEDLDAMVRGIKAAIKVASTRPFRAFESRLLPVAFPGCSHERFGSDGYWACAARHVSTTLGHFVGTCSMAPRQRGGVVDPRLRVYGIKALRVVDASVMPEIIAGHTCAPTYMIAEKAADMIKRDWGVLGPPSYS